MKWSDWVVTAFECHYTSVLFKCLPDTCMTLKLIVFEWTSVSGHTNCDFTGDSIVPGSWFPFRWNYLCYEKRGYWDFHWLQYINCIQEDTQSVLPQKKIREESTAVSCSYDQLTAEYQPTEWLSGWLVIIKLHRWCHQINIGMWQWDHCEGRFDKGIKELHYSHWAKWYGARLAQRTKWWSCCHIWEMRRKLLWREHVESFWPRSQTGPQSSPVVWRQHRDACLFGVIFTKY